MRASLQERINSLPRCRGVKRSCLCQKTVFIVPAVFKGEGENDARLSRFTLLFGTIRAA